MFMEAADNYIKLNRPAQAEQLYKEAIARCDKTDHSQNKAWTPKMQSEFEEQCTACKKKYAALVKQTNGSARLQDIPRE